MANDTPASDSSLAGETQPPTQGTSAVSIYADSKASILLQTSIALASNPASIQSQEKHGVRIILDSGSQKTNITQQRKEILGLKPISRKRLCFKTFGSVYTILRLLTL